MLKEIENFELCLSIFHIFIPCRQSTMDPFWLIHGSFTHRRKLCPTDEHKLTWKGKKKLHA